MAQSAFQQYACDSRGPMAHTRLTECYGRVRTQPPVPVPVVIISPGKVLSCIGRLQPSANPIARSRNVTQGIIGIRCSVKGGFHSRFREDVVRALRFSIGVPGSINAKSDANGASMESHAVETSDFLPLIKGPKLGRFRGGKFPSIVFLQLLGQDPDDDESPEGTHGYVFKVSIGKEIFALKIFKFFDPETMRLPLGPRHARLTDEEIIGQTDPFYAECRAYGRIKSKPRKTPIAVACHGFVAIKATVEPELRKRFKIYDWEWPEEDLIKPPEHRRPFRGLVKDLVETQPEWSEALLKRMLQDLKALHSLKIYVMDIAARNYRGGKLVDFGASWTEPHFGFRSGLRSKAAINQSRGEDAYQFDAMIEEAEFDTNIRALPSRGRLAKLYSTKHQSAAGPAERAAKGGQKYDSTRTSSRRKS